MTLGPFVAGEQPADPIVLTVVDADGNAVDLDAYDTVALTGTLPAGTTTPLAGGIVQYKVSAPFADVGTFEIRVVMTQADGDVDYSQPFEYSVVAARTTTLVTPEDVHTLTGSTVTPADIVTAQSVIGLVAGLDPTDADVLASLSTRDTYWLKQAIAWQAVDEASDTVVEYIPGATRVQAGDVSVSFSNTGTATGEAVTSRYAQMALKRLSWLKPFRSVQAKPFSRRLTPDEAAQAVIAGTL